MVYIVGGYDGNTIFGDIWRLDLLTLQWIKLVYKIYLKELGSVVLMDSLKIWTYLKALFI